MTMMLETIRGAGARPERISPARWISLLRLSLIHISGTGYKPDDYKYIDLYREYEQMRRKGDKVTYCVAFLSARHGVSERKAYEILGRFNKECTFHTV